MRWFGRVLFALTVGMLTVNAQQAPKDVTPHVRGVEQRYESAKTLSAVFLERYSENRATARIESGQLYLSRGGRMRWEYESPEKKLFVSDGKLVWFYVPSDRTVTRTKLKESDDWRTPIALLAGKVKFSRFCRRIEFAGVPPSSTQNTVLRCLPKSKDSGFSELILEVEPGGWIARVLIHEVAGVETEFRFAKWQQIATPSPGLFQFTAPPGVAIVEEQKFSQGVR